MRHQTREARSHACLSIRTAHDVCVYIVRVYCACICVVCMYVGSRQAGRYALGM